MDLEHFFVQRFDLTAKLLYAKYGRISWFKELYKNHIFVFNGGAEDSPRKSCVDDFVNSFDLLIQQMKLDSKFNPKTPIPIGNNGHIINGAHRVALCYFLHIKPIFEFYQDVHGVARWNYHYFLNRYQYPICPPPHSNPNLIPPSMDQKYTDRMALEFCLSFSNYKIILLFPAGVGKDEEFEEELKQNGTIYYKKVVNITERGLINLTHELYRGEEWIGGMFPTFENKGKRCFVHGSPLRVYIYIPNKDTNIISLKLKVREMYGVGNHSIHIHDTYEEGLRIAKSILNHNSLMFLMQGDPSKLSDVEKSLLLEFYTALQQKAPQEREYFAIDTSFVLSVHGLREAHDLDYIFLEGSTTDVIVSTKGTDCHQNRGSALHFQKEIILFVPDNHFYFMGIKFASLTLVKEIKKKSNEQKDIMDVALIENYMAQHESNS